MYVGSNQMKEKIERASVDHLGVRILKTFGFHFNNSFGDSVLSDFSEKEKYYLFLTEFFLSRPVFWHPKSTS